LQPFQAWSNRTEPLCNVAKAQGRHC